MSQEVINTETWSTFQFLSIFSAESDIHLFFNQYVGKTILVFQAKIINMAVVAEQTTGAFGWKLIGFI